MLLTDSQLHEIRQIIADHHSAFVANVISPRAVAPDTLERLRSKGLLNVQINSVEDAYLYGQLLAALEDPKVAKMSYEQFKAHLKRNPIPLSPIEQRAVQIAEHSAGQYAKGLGNRIDLQTGQVAINADMNLQAKMRDTIRTATAESLAKREIARQLASNLGHETKDWARDWDRIAITEMHNAKERGTADVYAKRYGSGVKMAKRVMGDACEHCFTGQTGIETREGLKAISDIKIGDEVFTHRLRWRKVTHVFQREYSGDIYGFNGDSAHATGNHPYLVDGHWRRADTVKTGQHVGMLRTIGYSDQQPPRVTQCFFFPRIPITSFGSVVPTSPINLNCYFQGGDSYINVVNVDSHFQYWIQMLQKFSQVTRFFWDQTLVFLSCLRNFLTAFLATNSGMCFSCGQCIGFDQTRKRPRFRIFPFFSDSTSLLRSIKVANGDPGFFERAYNIAFPFLVLFRQFLESPKLILVQDGGFLQIHRVRGSQQGFVQIPNWYPLPNQNFFNPSNRNSIFSVKGTATDTHLIASDQILDVHLREIHEMRYTQIDAICKEDYNGTVYNLSVADDESYFANGIVVHNCTRLHVGPDGHPRIFTLAELERNGTNHGRKARDWKPTVSGIHPHCQCVSVRIPEGWGFNEHDELVPGGAGGIAYNSHEDMELAMSEELDLAKSVATGHVDFQGLPIEIENAPGTVRHWKSPDGQEGETVMLFAYGEIEGTMGDDGDPIDVFVGPDPRAKMVYIVHQQNPQTGIYDEAKCFLGFPHEQAARMAYQFHFNRPDFLVTVSPMALDHFKRWAAGTKAGDRLAQGKPGTRYVIPLEKSNVPAPGLSSMGNVSPEMVETQAGARAPGPGVGANYLFNTPKRTRTPTLRESGFDPAPRELFDNLARRHISGRKNKEDYAYNFPLPDGSFLRPMELPENWPMVVTEADEADIEARKKHLIKEGLKNTVAVKNKVELLNDEVE